MHPTVAYNLAYNMTISSLTFIYERENKLLRYVCPTDHHYNTIAYRLNNIGS
jgi:hypothetical protein